LEIIISQKPSRDVCLGLIKDVIDYLGVCNFKGLTHEPILPCQFPTREPDVRRGCWTTPRARGRARADTWDRADWAAASRCRGRRGVCKTPRIPHRTPHRGAGARGLQHGRGAGLRRS